MAGTLFWDVDTQHDFMRAEGALYVPGSEEIIPTLRRLTDFAHQQGIRILASADAHEPHHPELSDTPDFHETFPPHCIRGTPGQRKIPETALRDPLVVEPVPHPPEALAERVRRHEGDVLVHKHWFDVFTNPNVPAILDALAPDHIALYGVATDVCNRYAIEGLLRERPDAQLWFVTDAARAIHVERTAALIAEWSERGVRMVMAEEVLAGRVPPGGRAGS